MDVHLIDGTYELFRHFFAVPSTADSNGQELCSRCGHERDFHGPDCRAETSDKRYLHLCPCIAFVPPKEPNTQKEPPCKQVTH